MGEQLWPNLCRDWVLTLLTSRSNPGGDLRQKSGSSAGCDGMLPVLLEGPANLFIISSMHSRDSQRTRRSASVLIVKLCSDRAAKASASRKLLVAWFTDSFTWVLRAIWVSVGFFSIAIVGSILFRQQETFEKLIVSMEELFVLIHDTNVFCRASHCL